MRDGAGVRRRFNACIHAASHASVLLTLRKSGGGRVDMSFVCCLGSFVCLCLFVFVSVAVAAMQCRYP